MMLPTAQEVLLSADRIQARVRTLAAEIEADLSTDRSVHFVCVLKGAFIFLADLIRAMTAPVTLDFIAVSSYGKGLRSSGEVRLLKDLDFGLEGRDVVIIEDIVDTGLTLVYLQEILRARAPRSLRTACLLSKPSRRLVDVTLDYLGFEIEDRFVVGYGLDFDERFRHLPHIAVLDPPPPDTPDTSPGRQVGGATERRGAALAPAQEPGSQPDSPG